MEQYFDLGNILSMLITGIATWGGTFLFYRQEKKSRDIDNESKQSDEWRKLYLDSQEDSRSKDKKIDELRKEMAEMRKQINKLEHDVSLNTIYRCMVMGCDKRNPPLRAVSPVAIPHLDHQPSPSVEHDTALYNTEGD